MHKAYVASDLVPAVTFWLVALVATVPAFMIVRRSKRGRARSAIAYLAGFFAGLAASVGLALAAPTLAGFEGPLLNAGVTAAFLGPFTGIVHAKLRRSGRRRPKWAEAGAPRARPKVLQAFPASGASARQKPASPKREHPPLVKAGRQRAERKVATR